RCLNPILGRAPVAQSAAVEPIADIPSEEGGEGAHALCRWIGFSGRRRQKHRRRRKSIRRQSCVFCQRVEDNPFHLSVRVAALTNAGCSPADRPRSNREGEITNPVAAAVSAANPHAQETLAPRQLQSAGFLKEKSLRKGLTLFAAPEYKGNAATG